MLQGKREKKVDLSIACVSNSKRRDQTANLGCRRNKKE
jgi:hypothetical protein